MTEAKPEIVKNHVNYVIGGYSLLLVIAIFFMVIYTLNSRKQTVDNLKRDALNISTLTEQTLLASIQTIDVAMEHISFEVRRDGNSRRLTEDDREHYLNSLRISKGVLLTWINEKGEPLGKEFQLRSADGKSKLNYSDRPYFKQLKISPPGTRIVTEPAIGKLTHIWVFLIAKRLEDSRGNFKGAVLVAITPAFFEQIRNSLSLPENSSFSVAVGSPARFFYRYPTDPSIIGKELIPRPDAEDVILGRVHRDVFDTHSPVDGVERIAAHSWVGKEPLIIIHGLDKRLALKTWKTQTIFISVIATCLLFLLFGFSAFFFSTTKRLEEYREKLAINLKTSAIGQLAGEIAHEVNSPLSTIQLNTSQVKRLLEADPIDRKLCSERVDKILKTAENISKIINGIKNASRKGEQDAREALSIAEIIDECIIVTQERIKSSGIDLRFVNNLKNEKVSFVRVQLTQVLLNLIGNAADAVQENPEKWLRIEANQVEDLIEISVIDSGKGIDPMVAKALFKPFVTTKKDGKGTGLGLSISKRIVESHGGSLYLNRERKNTCFTIRLPRYLDKRSSDAA